MKQTVSVPVLDLIGHDFDTEYCDTVCTEIENRWRYIIDTVARETASAKWGNDSVIHVLHSCTQAGEFLQVSTFILENGDWEAISDNKFRTVEEAVSELSVYDGVTIAINVA